MNEFVFIEELIYCPSQIYYYFTDSKGEKYCIYLRWRYHDPWTSELVKCDDSYSFSRNCEDWEPIETRRKYKDTEYLELEEEVLDLIKSRFLETQFPSTIEREKTTTAEYVGSGDLGWDVITSLMNGKN